MLAKKCTIKLISPTLFCLASAPQQEQGKREQELIWDLTA